MVTAEIVQAEVRDLRAAVDAMRNTMTATVLRTETLENQARNDSGTIQRLEAAVRTLEQRAIGLLTENEDLRSLLQDVVEWLDEALGRNGASGLSSEMREAAALFAARIHRSEERHAPGSEP